MTRPGTRAHVALWDAINAYAEACGGATGPGTAGTAREAAVVRVEAAAVVWALESVIMGNEERNEATGATTSARRNEL